MAQQRMFDIPGEDPRQAIPEFARQAGMLISAPTGRPHGMNTRKILGTMDVRVALGKMIEGTGLSILSATGNVIVLHYAPADQTVPSPSGASGADGAVVASTPAAADPPAEDIVVTAQRREERLSTAPVTVTAITGKTATQLGITQPTQLTSIVPNLQIQNAGTIPKIAIRGIALNDFSYANESPIGIYTNDVYLASPLAGFGQFFDISRIEVLRGPQGTLFGRNATGGLIQIITNKPTADYSGYGSIQYGSFNQVLINAAQDIPLGDHVRTRTAGTYNRDDGFEKSVVSGARFGRTNVWAVRETVDADLAANLTNSLIGHYNKSDSQNNLAVFRGTIDPVTHAMCSVAQINANQCVTSAGLRNPNPKPYDTYTSLKSSPNHYVSWGLSDTLRYRGAGFNVTSVTAYEYLSAQYLGDVALVPNSIFIDSYDSTRKQFSQEIRADGGFGQFKWVAGVYYFHDKIPFAYVTAPVLIALVHATLGLQNQYRQTTDSAAGFGQVDFDITPKFTLTGGVRYTWEKKSVTITDDFTKPSFPAETYSPTSNIVTWKVGAKWQATAGVIAYANVATGFKTAAFDVSLVGPGGAAPAAPEKDTNYEIGIKGETSDRKLTATIVGFYTDYRQFQAITIPPGSFISRLYNVPKSDIKGVEAELTARPVAGLSIDGSISYLHTKIIAPGVLIAGVPINGERLGLSPTISVKGGVRYDFKTDSIGTISPFIHADYRSTQWSGLPTTDFNIIPRYALVDTGVTYTSPDDKWTVEFLAQNALNKYYYTNNTLILGFDNVKFGDPRRLSIRVSRRW